MYLAFELLLSAKYPKGNEREINWLRTSLAVAAADLDLASLNPSHADPVSHIIDAVYSNARLPLFHATDGRTYFAPLRSNENRQEINSALQLLTLVVIRMADVWHQTRRLRGGVNLSLIQNADKRIFDQTSFVASSRSDFNLEADLSQPAIQSGIRFEAKLIDQFNTQPRPHMYGRVDVTALEAFGALRVLALIDQQRPLMESRLEAALDLSGFDILEAQIFLRAINATEPRTLFPR